MPKLIGFLFGAALVGIPALWLLDLPAQTRQPEPAPETEVVPNALAPRAPISAAPDNDPASAGRKDSPSLADRDPRHGRKISSIAQGDIGVSEIGGPAQAASGKDLSAGNEPQPTAPMAAPAWDLPGKSATEDIVNPETALSRPPRDADPAPETSVAPGDASPNPAEPGSQLQLLWSPFRTQNSASGFAHRLSKVSGVNVRVAVAAPGRYRVGFDYTDEIERKWFLGQIRARTGLDLDIPEVLTETDPDEDDAPDADTAVSGIDGHSQTR